MKSPSKGIKITSSKTPSAARSILIVKQNNPKVTPYVPGRSKGSGGGKIV